VLIEIERLTLEPLHVQHVYAVGELPFKHDDAALTEPIAADFLLTHRDRDLRVRGSVRTEIRYQCSRCLKEFSLPLNAGFDLLYFPQQEWKEEEEIELKYEDMDVGFYDGIRLDVDLMALEQIELAMPMKFICSEGCKGLCPSCGADLNETSCPCRVEQADSRLAVLRDFREKMKEQGS
jgi:uncharacterized protein